MKLNNSNKHFATSPILEYEIHRREAPGTKRRQAWYIKEATSQLQHKERPAAKDAGVADGGHTLLCDQINCTENPRQMTCGASKSLEKVIGYAIPRGNSGFMPLSRMYHFFCTPATVHKVCPATGKISSMSTH